MIKWWPIRSNITVIFVEWLNFYARSSKRWWTKLSTIIAIKFLQPAVSRFLRQVVNLMRNDSSISWDVHKGQTETCSAYCDCHSFNLVLRQGRQLKTPRVLLFAPNTTRHVKNRKLGQKPTRHHQALPSSFSSGSSVSTAKLCCVWLHHTCRPSERKIVLIKTFGVGSSVNNLFFSSSVFLLLFLPIAVPVLIMLLVFCLKKEIRNFYWQMTGHQ